MYYNHETDRTAPASVWVSELGGDGFYLAVTQGVLIREDEYYG